MCKKSFKSMRICVLVAISCFIFNLAAFENSADSENTQSSDVSLSDKSLSESNNNLIIGYWKAGTSNNNAYRFNEDFTGFIYNDSTKTVDNFEYTSDGNTGIIKVFQDDSSYIPKRYILDDEGLIIVDSIYTKSENGSNSLIGDWFYKNSSYSFKEDLTGEFGNSWSKYIGKSSFKYTIDGNKGTIQYTDSIKNKSAEKYIYSPEEGKLFLYRDVLNKVDNLDIKTSSIDGLILDKIYITPSPNPFLVISGTNISDSDLELDFSKIELKKGDKKIDSHLLSKIQNYPKNRYKLHGSQINDISADLTGDDTLNPGEEVSVYYNSKLICNTKVFDIYSKENN